jgi:hypothetical protein
MASRMLHRLTEVQVRNARPAETVLPNADYALHQARKHHNIRAAVMDKRNRPVLLQGAVQVVRDGKPVVIKRRTRWLCDGGGLWLVVSPGDDPDSVRRSWIFRYTMSGRQRRMGLGSANGVLTLAEVREKARECRKQLLSGIDPIVARDGKAAAVMVAEKKLKTFDVVRDEYLLVNGDKWSRSHRANVIQSLRDWISPVIGNIPISAVDTQLAIKALTDLYEKRPTTAGRVIGRCADVYAHAVFHGYASDPNPFRYKDHLEIRFPHKTEVDHLPALHFSKVPSLWRKLIRIEGLASLALQWTTLTVARTGETLQALASEIDHERQLWRVPKSHKKTRRHMEDDDYIQPLTDEAMAVLAKIGRRKPDERLFPFAVDSGVMIDVLHAINPDITVHGTTRGAFKTWSREATATDSDVVRACMSHKGGASAVDLAYHRGPLYVEKKRKHLQIWANYVTGAMEMADVVTISRKRA